MHTSEYPLSPQAAGRPARRTYANTARRGTQILVTTLLLCLTLSACGRSDSAGTDGASDSKLGSDNKTREVRCAR